MKGNEFNTGVYQIINRSNGKKYIGSAVNLRNRKENHFYKLEKKNHKNQHMQRAYSKHGKENFKFEILLYCSKEDLIFYEQRAICAYNFEKELYNILPTAGSFLGKKCSEETKEKIRNSRKGRKHLSESIRKMSEIKKGKRVSEETKRKMSDAKIGKKKSIETREKFRQANLGRKHTEETKEKLRRISTGKPVSQETRNKISMAQRGKIISKETRRKISESFKKPIKVFFQKTNEFAGEYNSGIECAKMLGINRKGISKVLRKERKQHKGYTFEYINEKDKINVIH